MTDEGIKIGSSRIRNLLKEGNLSVANRLLGQRYAVLGTIVKGKGRGKILGFPTANIDFDGYFLPRTGVYATLIELDGVIYQSMTNIGDNPTFYGKVVTLETHIFRFNESVYGKTIRLEFHAFIRDDTKFTTTVDLVAQLQKDSDKVRKLFQSEEIL